MTDQDPTQTPPPADGFTGEPTADEPTAAAQGGSEGSTNARAREWLSQLEAMIQDIATQAAPVARQVAAKAAELTAVAAVKAGPLAHKAAEVTTDAGHKLAERAQSLASELRGEAPSAPAEDVAWDDAPGAASDAPMPEATTGDATSSTDGTTPGGSI